MDARILNGKIYDNGNLGGRQIGSIRNGRIYEGSWMGGNEIGRIRENGDIVIHGSVVGRINDNNEICEGWWMGRNAVGRIAPNGEIKCGFWMGGDYAGRIVFDDIKSSSEDYLEETTSYNKSAPNLDLTAVPNSVFGLISAVIVVLILKLLGASMLKIVIVAIFTCALVAGWMDVVKMFKINKADSSRYGGTVRFEEVIGSVIATIVYFFILFV